MNDRIDSITLARCDFQYNAVRVLYLVLLILRSAIAQHATAECGDGPQNQ
jgi:hypothetical protein